MKYFYYVVGVGDTGDYFYGTYENDKKIRNFKDIQEMVESVCIGNNFNTFVPINFKLLRKE